MACPGCLKAAGKTAADLGTGIQVADKQACFSFTKGRILTLDDCSAPAKTSLETGGWERMTEFGL